MIIFGTAGFHKVLGVMMALCGRCHNHAAHHILKRGTKFSLFFIPLFPVSSYYALECSICGQQRRLTRQEAESLAASGQQQSAPAQPQQFGPQGNAQGPQGNAYGPQGNAYGPQGNQGNPWQQQPPQGQQGPWGPQS